MSNGLKRATVERTRAMPLKRFEVCLGAVAFVFFESIFGKVNRCLTHDPISGYFGKNTGGRNGKTLGITFHDPEVRIGKIGDAQSINEAHPGFHPQCGNRTSHPEVGRTEHIDLINFIRFHQTERRFTKGM